MARLRDTVVEVPYPEKLVCPVCEEPIHIKAFAQLTDGIAREVGSTSFKKNITVNISAKLIRIKIEHVCNYEETEV